MPRNEEGEFELVLGNRQLLSGFFIVVILFGVFFTMGYIVGRHSSPPGVAELAGGAAVVPRPSPVDRSDPPAADSKRNDPAPAEPSGPVTTTAAVEPAHQELPEPKRDERKPPPEVSAPPAGEPAASAAAGTYLQVAAPKRVAAEGVLAALKKLEIIATLLPGPDENTVRVVVGPFKDAAAMGKMRTELEKAGFKPFIKKVN